MLDLQEIIWEITPECDKGCDYCGSKDVLKNKCVSSTDLKRIATAMAAYNPSEVNLSGGEPGVLACNDPETFDEVVRILTDSGLTKVKVVSYGKILDADINFDKISVIGFSVNNKLDIEYLTNTVDTDKNTMITNFGNHNIWEFDALLEFAKNFGCWQVQLTMGKYQLSPEGIKYLRNKLMQPMTADVGFSVVLADNLQACHQCSAGMRSCGVTYTGDVIACLSERSYGECKSYGNLLETPLKEIWENGFKDCRFGTERKCCRDCIVYPEVEAGEPSPSPYVNLPYDDCPDAGQQVVTMLYMVATPPMSVMAYAVIPPETKTTVYTGNRTVKPVYAVTRPPAYPYRRRNNDWDSGSGGGKMMYGVFGGW